MFVLLCAAQETEAAPTEAEIEAERKRKAEEERLAQVEAILSQHEAKLFLQQVRDPLLSTLTCCMSAKQFL